MKHIRPPLVAASRAFVAVAALWLAGGSLAAPVKTPHVEAELVAATTALVPGEPVTVALRLSMEKGWHTYWQNPGDSGLPTTLAWRLPAGIEAGPIEWPAPRELPVGPLVNYGYEGEVLHLVPLRVPRQLAVGDTVVLAARAEWLVCKEVCIPEGADVTLALPVQNAAPPDPRWGVPIAAARAALPRPLAGWRSSAEGRGDTIALTLVPPARAADPGTIRFFPFAPDRIEPSGPQRVTRNGDAYVVTLPVATTLTGGLDRIAGVVTAAGGFGSVHAATLDVALTGSVVAGSKAAAAPPALNLAPAPMTGGDGATLVLAVVSALLGGLILNLMPCVFPVLTLKVLGFATHNDTRPTLRHEAGAFAAGVVLTFVALGAALAVLRAAGEQLGWGFQLQSPAVVSALAILFFVLALNLSGVFEFGQLAPSGVTGWTSKNRTLDAFGSGILAVVVASPCTAPFMGAALGFAMTGSTTAMLVVFVALGVGMALPYVCLAWFPGWRRRLPRPGPWLERFKQALAFPLYATVIWLAWVLGAQRDDDALSRLLIVLLCVGIALWAWRIVRTGGARPWGIAVIIALAGAVTLAWPLFAVAPSAQAKSAGAAPASDDGAWAAFTPETVAALVASGRPVFVDFTAAWCVTCQVNKRLVLNADDVRARFAEKGVALVRADWTRRDPAITQALAALGRNGVPVYVLYRPGKEPLLLPEVLQRSTMHEVLATL